MSIIKHSFEYCKAAVSDDRNLQVFFTFALAAIVLMVPADVWAAATNDGAGVGQVVCRIVDVLQGPIARGVAAFGIIFLGFSLFLGKISWGVALALGIGIGAIFGAEQIVELMAGNDDDNCASIMTTN